MRILNTLFYIASVYAFISGSLLFADEDKPFVSRGQDKDAVFKVNQGGTFVEAFRIKGTTGDISFPKKFLVFATSISGSAIGVSPTTTNVVINSEVSDDQNVYNNSTGVVTIPDDGLYRITLSFTSSGLRDINARVRLNGSSTVLSGAQGYASSRHVLTGPLSLSASDELTFTAENFGSAVNFSGGADSNFLLIEKLR